MQNFFRRDARRNACQVAAGRARTAGLDALVAHRRGTAVARGREGGVLRPPRWRSARLVASLEGRHLLATEQVAIVRSNERSHASLRRMKLWHLPLADGRDLPIAQLGRCERAVELRRAEGRRHEGRHGRGRASDVPSSRPGALGAVLCTLTAPGQGGSKMIQKKRSHLSAPTGWQSLDIAVRRSLFEASIWQCVASAIRL